MCGDSRLSKFRMNIPKTEEDLKELMKELSEEHHHDHHHHHGHFEEEIIVAINALIDAVNDLSGKIQNLEKRLRALEKQTLTLGKLHSLSLKIQFMEEPSDKEKIFNELSNILNELEKRE